MPEEIEPQLEEIVEEPPKINLFDKIKIHKPALPVNRFKILGKVLGVLFFAGTVFGVYKLGQRQAQFVPQPTPTPVVTPTSGVVVPPEEPFVCVDRESLNCAEEIELSFQCTEEYQSWAEENCPGWEEIPSRERVYCEDPRPQVCTMLCISNPPYICGSDGKSYCSECQACSNSEVKWYMIQDEPCGIG